MHTVGHVGVGRWVLRGAVALGCGLGLVAQTASPPANAAGQNAGVFVVGGAPATPAATVPAAVVEPVGLLPNPAPAEIEHIIQVFTTNEKMFRELLANDYVYTESIVMQELTSDGNPDGSFRQVNQVQYDDGQRDVVCTFCPQPTLKSIGVTEDDITDMFNMNMYTLSVDELPEYNITYVDHEPLDKVTVYKFRVQPKQIVKGHRYFDGVVYVDDHDLMIVKSDGRVVPNQYDKHGNPTNTFLPFQVWREKVDGKYWFPVYTLMQGTVPGAQGMPGTPMRMVIQFKDYKRFRATTRILSVQAVPETGKPPAAIAPGATPAPPKKP